MADLSHTKIYRGGVTAPHLSLETRRCHLRANKKDNCIDIRFELASKGGGTTQVLIQIGAEDFETIINDIADTLPQSADILAAGAVKSNRKNLDLLQEALATQNNNEKLKSKIIEQLEPVEEFISEKYWEAEAGSDEREADLRDKLEKLIMMLRS